jgi:uncharacterized protein
LSTQTDLAIEHEHSVPALRDIPLRWNTAARLPVLALIRAYQLTISRGLPSGTCRFYPTCSHYGYEAIAKYGLIKGGWLAAWRVMRCQPFNPGGYDPVP